MLTYSMFVTNSLGKVIRLQIVRLGKKEIWYVHNLLLYVYHIDFFSMAAFKYNNLLAYCSGELYVVHTICNQL